MEKIDFKKKYKNLYLPSAKEPVVVDVPEMQFAMVDGEGYPGTSKEYMDSMMVLYGLAYTLKFTSKLSGGPDWTIPPLEGLWWADDMEAFGDESRKEEWKWTSMIMQPDFVTQDQFEAASKQLKEKKNPEGLEKARLEKYNEGLCVQIMHIGPYTEEAPTIQKLHQFAEDNGYSLRDKHHEIYLGDPRRTAPDKLRTVIRQPVSK
ncbi:MAG: hypothetical protein C4562_06265 [Actinobacteria bacterium]|nr:MAG: hypothetical protein C4562_06265 [Actinomycetota bacterium]